MFLVVVGKTLILTSIPDNCPFENFQIIEKLSLTNTVDYLVLNWIASLREHKHKTEEPKLYTTYKILQHLLVTLVC